MPGAEGALHQDGVEPTSVLETGPFDHPDMAEAEPLMQADGGGMFGSAADHRDHLAISTRFADFDQFPQEGSPDATALRARRDIDAVLH